MKILVLTAALAAVVSSLPRPGRNRNLQLNLSENKNEDLSLQHFNSPVEAARSNQEIPTQHFKFNMETDNKKFGHLAHNPEDEVQTVSQEKCKKQKRKACYLETKKRVAKHVKTPKPRDSNKDADLHDQMEVTKQALEHIQQYLGNLEAINVQTTTLNDAESLRKARFTITNPTIRNVAHWEDSMEHIEKNADEERNAEDGLKLTSSKIEAPLVGSEFNKIAKESVSNPSSIESARQVSKNVEGNELDMSPSATEHKEIKETQDIVTGQAKEATTESEDFDTRGKTADQSLVSLDAPLDVLVEKSSEQIEKKSAPLEESENEEDIIAQHQKSSEPMDLAPAPSQSLNMFETHPDHQTVQDKNDIKMIAKSSENNVDTSLDAPLEPKEKSVNLENSKNDEDSIPQQHQKSSEPMDLALAPSQSVNEWENNADHQMKIFSKSSENNAEEVPSMPMSKNVEKNILDMSPAATEHKEIKETHDILTGQAKEATTELEDLDTQGKTADPSPVSLLESDDKNRPDTLLDVHSDFLSQKSLEQKEKSVNLEDNKNEDDTSAQQHQKSSEPMDLAPSPSQSVNTWENQPDHHTLPGKSDMKMFSKSSENNVEERTSLVSQSPMMKNKESMEADNVSLMKMASAMGKASMEQWKAKEALAARGAYGAAGGLIAGGPGAIGVFPGAKVGGCGIPLLLSCSPSVIHGSLASGPAYAAHAHAYRNTEDFEGSFLTKRHVNDVKAKVKRTPSYKNIHKILYNKS